MSGFARAGRRQTIIRPALRGGRVPRVSATHTSPMSRLHLLGGNRMVGGFIDSAFLHGEQAHGFQPTPSTCRRDPIQPDLPGVTESAVPSTAAEVVRYGSSRQLEPQTRSFFERRFGCDFGHVRVHTDGRAADSARLVDARAYSVGGHIVFGRGHYSPGTVPGQRLLAHELTHVVQQRGFAAGSSPLILAARDHPAEREAERLSLGVAGAKPASVRERVAAAALHRQPCRPFLDEPELAGGRVSGVAAHSAIARDFAAQPGVNAIRTQIPSASFSPYRDNDPYPSMISPITYGGPRTGDGIPDLAHKRGDILELSEIKPGTISHYVDGEEQILNYINKGNDRIFPAAARWRSELGIRVVTPMPTSRFVPTSPLDVGGVQVSVVWCGAGIIVYKAVQHPEVFVCRYISDRGQTDIFLERVTGRAQGMIDQYIDSVIDPAITQAIRRLTIRQAIRFLYRSGREALRDWLARRAGGGPAGRAVADSLLRGLPEDAVVDRVARWIEEQLGPQAELLLRNIAQRVKTTLLFRVRTWLKTRVRSFLQEGLTVLCAAAFSVSAAMLLRWLWRNLMRYFAQGVKEVVEAFVRELISELAKALAVVVLAVAAVAAIIFFLPEILAGLAAAAEILGPILLALGPLIGRLLPQIPRLVPGVP